jgi:hypothetical protein
MLTLQHPVSQIVAKLLADLGLGTTPTVNQVSDWPIYVSTETTAPDRQIRIQDTNPINLGRIQLTGEMIEHDGFQVTVRDRNYPTGMAKARAIADIFDKTVNNNDVTLATPTVIYRVQSIRRTSGILPFRDRKNNDLRLFTINAVVVLIER